MRNIILFDDQNRDDLLPLTFTRPASELRCGILTIREKWERSLQGEATYITQEYLARKYPIRISDDNYVINGHVLPNERLLKLILELNFNEAIMHKEDLIAARLSKSQFDNLIDNEQVEELSGFLLEETPAIKIAKPWDLFAFNEQEILADYRLLCAERESAPIPEHVIHIGSDLFIEEGAVLAPCTINSTHGPVYIGENAEIMEGCMIRGSLALCDHAILKMGAKIYGATTIGPACKVGGEVNNSIFLGYSNKAHDGFLGNSVIGEWCNLGADTNNSNLKNTYSDVKLWSYTQKSFISSEKQFCGLIMGDHSKAGINTMFNTGTVLGISSNVFGGGFLPKFVPSFSWGGANGFEEHEFGKAMQTASIVLKRRGLELTDMDQDILSSVLKLTEQFRQQ